MGRALAQLARVAFVINVASCSAIVTEGGGGAPPTGDVRSAAQVAASGSTTTGSGQGGAATGGGTASSSAGAGGSGTSTATNGGAGGAGSTGTLGGGAPAGAGGSGSCGGYCDWADPIWGFVCCDGKCVDTTDDPYNCRGCGNVCPSDKFYCDVWAEQCTPPPCSTTCPDPSQCCGDLCCGPGQLCCDPNGIDGPWPGCYDVAPGGTCPQGCAGCTCASPDTPVDTPLGERAIAELRAGDIVFSAEGAAVVAVPIVAVRSRVATDVELVRVWLGNGSILEMSDRHPTADGRRFGQLRAGDRIDGVLITRIERAPYRSTHTYDIRAATQSGAYFAGGVLVGSTLAVTRPARP